jgi:hypothetical protein
MFYRGRGGSLRGALSVHPGPAKCIAETCHIYLVGNSLGGPLLFSNLELPATVDAPGSHVVVFNVAFSLYILPIYDS